MDSNSCGQITVWTLFHFSFFVYKGACRDGQGNGEKCLLFVVGPGGGQVAPRLQDLEVHAARARLRFVLRLLRRLHRHGPSLSLSLSLSLTARASSAPATTRAQARGMGPAAASRDLALALPYPPSPSPPPAMAFLAGLQTTTPWTRSAGRTRSALPPRPPTTRRCRAGTCTATAR